MAKFCGEHQRYECECIDDCHTEINSWSTWARGHHMKGRLRSPEHVENQRQASIIFWATSEGKEEAYERTKEGAKNRRDYTGEGNPNWKGGEKLRFSTFSPDFDSDYILSRDNWTCQGCGSRTNLNVHHIDDDPTNEDRHNKITTCHSCNMKASRNDEKEYWKTYYSNKIVDIYSVDLQGVV